MVGAAVSDVNGNIFSGCNVENASYGLTICAERTAIFKAISEGARSIAAVAVVTDAQDLAMPCGACLQTIAEFGSQDTLVIISNLYGEKITLKFSDLLPNPFKFKKEL